MGMKREGLEIEGFCGLNRVGVCLYSAYMTLPTETLILCIKPRGSMYTTIMELCPKRPSLNLVLGT